MPDIKTKQTLSTLQTTSALQTNYLLHQKREKQFITFARILVFLCFLGLWEFSARFGLIDSFIFSSPCQIILTFLNMCKDHSLFLHIGVTLMETL